MKLYRCLNRDEHPGPVDFEVADGQPPVCPECKADARLPEHAVLIVKRELIHFMHKAKTGPIIGWGSRYQMACKPDQKTTGPHWQASGETVAVTCPACKASEIFQKIAGAEVFSGEAQHGAVRGTGELRPAATVAPIVPVAAKD